MRILFLTVLVGCAPQGATRATPEPAPRPTEAQPSGPATLGTLNGDVITIEDVNPELKAELIDLENELEQRRMHLNWVGFEEAVSDRLMAEEAKRRGISVETMTDGIAAEATVTDEEVRALYEANKKVIPVSFAEAAPTLRAQLDRDAGERAIRRYSEEL
ncbi:MAG: hypothetical protein AAFX94_14815, partial [Myxococcota bacterium]